MIKSEPMTTQDIIKQKQTELAWLKLQVIALEGEIAYQEGLLTPQERRDLHGIIALYPVAG